MQQSKIPAQQTNFISPRMSVAGPKNFKSEKGKCPISANIGDYEATFYWTKIKTKKCTAMF